MIAESDNADFEDYQIVAAIGEEATLEDAIVPCNAHRADARAEPGGAESL